MRTGRSIAAMSGSVAGSLVGLFLTVSPWMSRLNHANGSWTLATKTDFWSGLGVLVVGLVSMALYQGGLRREMAAVGLVSRRPRVEETEAVPEAAAPAASPAITDEQLLALVNSMVEDLEQRQPQQPAQAPPSTPDVKTPSDDDLVRLASALLSEIRTEQAPGEKVPSEPKEPPAPQREQADRPALMSEAELLKMATNLLEEIQRTRPMEPARRGSENHE
ncbi:hypothetical protein [Sulfobacillus harzensis]|uniref:Uncharacterized protein n=1 Tax=Sulfobacillus harzensis TaxID=2729629 RepID=A0A7Y0L544_9FIRM|nr:hypothetical protein [Sulfobacillus harzensis]NMP23451.1 hypothetical protein [Sulfobacillus harzensis]